eukprot:80733-Amphidinium_carterae.1
MYFLFDALWAAMLCVNDLLLTNSGAQFAGKDLYSKLLEVEFEGVSGRVSFDEGGNRRMEAHIVQLRYCTGCKDGNALSEHLSSNWAQSVQRGSACVSPSGFMMEA